MIIWLLLGLLVGGCSIKPGYLEESTVVFENRWKVQKIDPADLSPDEKQVYDSLGPPTYVRLFRTMDTRQKAYAWIYDQPEAPVEVVVFIEGKRVEEAALDPDTSALRESTRRTMRTVSLVAGVIALVPLIIFFVIQ
jgi:hypothetical protein